MTLNNKIINDQNLQFLSVDLNLIIPSTVLASIWTCNKAEKVTNLPNKITDGWAITWEMIVSAEDENRHISWTPYSLPEVSPVKSQLENYFRERPWTRRCTTSTDAELSIPWKEKPSYFTHSLSYHVRVTVVFRVRYSCGPHVADNGMKDKLRSCVPDAGKHS